MGEADGQAMVCVQATGLTDVTEVPIWLDISAQDGSAMGNLLHNNYILLCVLNQR